MTDHVTLVEVGPRDGLQNEKTIIPTETKIKFIELLAMAGHEIIEVGGFVSPKWVPQLADTDKIFAHLSTKTYTQRFPVLVPNMQGFDAALKAGAQEIALFGAVSESFSHKNINCSITDSFNRFNDIIKLAQAHHIRVRGYLSCVWGCPYEGRINPTQTLDLIHRFYALGFDEISLGDTIGVGTANHVHHILKALDIPKNKIAVHFHDTYGQAIANIVASLERDIRIIDASVAGLGGCPYAVGASGNVATEDVLYLLQHYGLSTPVNMEKLIDAGNYILSALQRSTGSKVAMALMSKKGV